MAATPQNVEMEAAKFLHKLIQESTDEPTKLATKLHVILQHMRSSGKENSMPYQVISRAMETVINQHGLDIEALMSQRQPLTSGSQPGESSLSQIAGSSQQVAVESDSKKPLTTEETAKIATFSSNPLHGPSSAGHGIYQGSANQLNSMKSHGSNAGLSGSYESAEPGNPLSMQFSNSYDNQTAAMLMHKTPAGKALDHEGVFPNVMANASKTLQGERDAEPSEKIKDASEGEAEHDKQGDGDEEGMDTKNARSVLDTDVKPSEKGEDASQGESGSGGIKENVSEEEQTATTLHVNLVGKEDNGSIDEVKIDEITSEKMKDVTDEQSVIEPPAVLEETEVSGTVDGGMVVETEAKPCEDDNDNKQEEETQIEPVVAEIPNQPEKEGSTSGPNEDVAVAEGEKLEKTEEEGDQVVSADDQNDPTIKEQESTEEGNDTSIKEQEQDVSADKNDE